MSAGELRVKINQFELADSDDFNTLQTFAGIERNQLLRYLLSRIGGSYTNFSSPAGWQAASANGAATFGTRHDVIGGVLVRPDNGGHLTVDAGYVGFFRPGFVSDSDYVIADTPGIVNPAALPFTANASGAPRIDIVECAPVEVVETTASRPIFNPVTKDFTPTVVDKHLRTRMQFRIRLGTPNAGFPVLDADWCPLAFVVVQSGAADFSESDLYDVRPLVSERDDRTDNTPVIDGSAYLAQHALLDSRGVQPTLSDTTLRGWWRGSFLGYRMGGSIERNTPSSLADFGVNTGDGGERLAIDYTGASLIASGGSSALVTVGQMNQLIAYFPCGLGRCVRYSQVPRAEQNADPQEVTSGVRLPRGPNGILMIGRSPNVQATGACVVTSLPDVFGVGIGMLGSGFVVGWLVGGGGTLAPCFVNGKRVLMPDTGAPAREAWNLTPPIGPGISPIADLATGWGPTGSSWNRNTNPNVFAVTAAKAITETRVVASWDSTPGYGSIQQVQLTAGAGGIYYGGGIVSLVNASSSGGSATRIFREELDVPSKDSPVIGGGFGAALERAILLESISTDFDVLTVESRVVGWEEA